MDSVIVRCTNCGGPCTAIDADWLVCPHCRERLTVSKEARLSLQAYSLYGGAPTTEECAQCGHPVHLAQGETRCPACGADCVASLKAAVQMVIRRADERNARVARAAEWFPIVKLSGGRWLCGACGAVVVLKGPGEFQPCPSCGRENKTTYIEVLAAMDRKEAEEQAMREVEALLAEGSEEDS